MLENIFRNMQPVVKNLLIINVLFFLATWVFEQQGISLIDKLGLFYVGAEEFQPYQLATHFFMHANILHIFFNMFGLVVFGNVLERIWGAQRFLLFYFITALGASFLHQFIQAIEIYNASGTFFPDFEHINGSFKIIGDRVSFPRDMNHLYPVWEIGRTPVVGASGAVYGLLMGVAMLFPNTEVYLYGAIPVKMKWLALGLGAIALISSVQDNPGDSVAHFAHLGGMLFAFILIKIWQKDKSQFY